MQIAPTTYWSAKTRKPCARARRDAELGPRREVYERYRNDEAKLDALLESGAQKARAIARTTIERVRGAIGIDLRR